MAPVVPGRNKAIWPCRGKPLGRRHYVLTVLPSPERLKSPKLAKLDSACGVTELPKGYPTLFFERTVKKMAYDYAKLCGRIVEKCGTQAIFAEKMGVSERTISLKLNNRVPWKQPEMQKAAQILGFPETEMQDYFFTLKVQSA